VDEFVHAVLQEEAAAVHRARPVRNVDDRAIDHVRDG
jgi:hypothetical protein